MVLLLLERLFLLLVFSRERQARCEFTAKRYVDTSLFASFYLSKKSEKKRSRTKISFRTLGDKKSKKKRVKKEDEKHSFTEVLDPMLPSLCITTPGFCRTIGD